MIQGANVQKKYINLQLHVKKLFTDTSHTKYGEKTGNTQSSIRGSF